MYEMKRTVNCSNIGRDGVIKNSAIVDFLQDCSIIHLDTHPVMAPFFEEENCVMFLVSRQIDFYRRPEYMEQLIVKTWTYELKRMYGFRNTIIFGGDGKPCIASIASGAFMDNATQRPIKVPQELVDRVKLYPKFDMEYLPRKISLPDSITAEIPNVQIAKCHIDMNKHVNNARYLDITDEFIDNETTVKRIRIEYKKPVKRGEQVKALISSQGNAYFVQLCDENGKAYCITEYDF